VPGRGQLELAEDRRDVLGDGAGGQVQLIAEPDDVAEAALGALAAGPSGSVWQVQAGRAAILVEPPDIGLARSRT
jgi:hypothetical protein